MHLVDNLPQAIFEFAHAAPLYFGELIVATPFVHNGVIAEEFKPVDKVAYAKFKNALISKWQENEPWAEFTKGEVNAFPGFDAIDQIHLISTTAAFSL